MGGQFISDAHDIYKRGGLEAPFQDLFSHMSGASWYLSVSLFSHIFPQGFPCGLCFSQHGSLGVDQTSYLAAQGSKDVPRDRMWNLPVSSTLSPETTTESFPWYSFGQISHRVCLYSKRGDIELTS